MNHSNISNVNDEVELLKEDEEIKEEKEIKEKPQEFIYNLINNSEKMKLLQEANKALHISNTSSNKIIFVYSKPKVGSTSLITSLRMVGSLTPSRRL